MKGENLCDMKLKILKVSRETSAKIYNANHHIIHEYINKHLLPGDRNM